VNESSSEKFDPSLARRLSSQELSRTTPARILIAEDDHEMRTLIELTLAPDRYEITSVASGRQLFDTLRAASLEGRLPDLIVSDICMPGMTGLEVLDRVRASSIHLPVVLITAFGDEQTRNRAAALGGTVLFSKPFDMDDLRTAVMFLLAGEPHQRPAPQDLA
jgi:CheY-like chemotaxis protein